MCMCPHGFTGVDCEVEFDECVLKNCTVCVDGICQCPTGECTAGRCVGVCQCPTGECNAGRRVGVFS